MITRLEVDGFKSLRDFAVDLEPFTVFIGPNSAGKSNILEALALLSRLATQPIVDAFRGGRGRPSDQFTRMGSETASAMRFAVEFLTYGESKHEQGPGPAAQSRYRYELTIERQLLTSGTERLRARGERFRAMRAADDSWMASRSKFHKYAAYEREELDLAISPIKQGSDDQRITGLPDDDWNEWRIPASHTALSLPYPGFVNLRENLQNCRSLQIGTAKLGEPSDRIDSGSLAADGSNLPTVLAELPAPLLGEIRADLVAMVPGITSFDVVPDDDKLRIDFELSGGDRMPARLVSDGTLRLLVLLTAIRIEPRPRLIGIEEPENGIYPGRLRTLLDLFQEETNRRYEEPEALAVFDAELKAMSGELGLAKNILPTQILLTTHSPVILAALRKQPHHLRFVDAVRRDGHRFTRVRTVGRPGAGDHGRFTVSPREIDLLLDAAQSEEPA